jgi:hypothetical protein
MLRTPQLAAVGDTLIMQGQFSLPRLISRFMQGNVIFSLPRLVSRVVLGELAVMSSVPRLTS